MSDIVQVISQADAEELEVLLRAVLGRYAVLFPDWEVSTVSIQKSMDRNTQIDRFIELLTNMKALPMDDELPTE